ncbi:MAG: cob(I)yrinic acid a,c-diamide adenosyltransferase [Planctomycetales bacterium]|nr:cob(I)yrinic acid a,c-diamide adenosyltransferase [Planctomycetales bacterium]
MKIYTRSGDQGLTSLFGGGRVTKCDARIEAYGTIDELNATLGVARSLGVSPPIDEILHLLQNQLFDLGAELANPRAADQPAGLLQDNDVAQLEAFIDSSEADLPELKNFILPGGATGASLLHLARCVCRRAEREIVALSQVAPVRETVIKYMNRTGDLLFVLARAANAAVGVDDTLWQKQ